MAEKDKAKELEEAIGRFYERYSAKRIALATFLVGLLCLGGSLAAYWFFGNGLFAALGGLILGFVGINVAFLLIVPPASSLHKASNLITEAIKEPSRIKSYDMNKVQLADSKGKVHSFAARELGVWNSLVVPYLIKCQASGEQPTRKRSQRILTASER